MRKYILLLLAILATTIAMQSQNSNTWIDFNKTYYKFQLDETGIYRIPTSVLSTTGLSLVGDDFQLFYKGQEIPIYVTNAGAFGASDYIEFYGEQNDGEFDTQLFASSSEQLQTKTSLFSDESTYFLTTNVGANKRFDPLTNDVTNAPVKEDYFMYESYSVNENSYHFGEPYFAAGAFSFFSTFDEGEGFCGPTIRNNYTEIDNNGDGILDIINQNVGYNYRVNTNNVYTAAPEQAHFTSRVVGRNSSVAVNFDKHIDINLIDPITLDTTVFVTDSFNKFQVEQFEFDANLSFLEINPDFTGNARTKVNFKAFDGIKFGWPYQTKYSLALLTVNYPRDFDFAGKEVFEFELEIAQTKYFEIENFIGGADVVLYDLTEEKKIDPIVSGTLHQFKLDPASYLKRRFVLVNTNAANAEIKSVNSLEQRNFVDYSLVANQGDYIIITNNALRQGSVDQIQRYEDYRESAIGGSHVVTVADIDELYDQFTWGIEKHPMSIKNFLKEAYNSWSLRPKHVNIIGKGVRYEKTRFDQVAFDVCLVPSYGYIATDLMFTTATTQNYLPRLAIGRIPAQNVSDVKAYLDKVLEYEALFTAFDDCATVEQRKWMKDIIQIAKGWGSNETNFFQTRLDEYKVDVTGEQLGYNVIEEFQDLAGSIPTNQENNYQANPNVQTRLEDGLAMITYFGHSAPKVNYWQFDMQHPSNYNNEGKYPFIYTNSCFVGKMNDFFDKTCMAEDYTLADNGGSIGFLAGVALSSPSFLHLFTSKFMKNISTDHFGSSIGQNIKNTIADIYNPNDDGIKIVSNEFTLAGDPAIELYHWDEPEFSLTNSTVNVLPTGIIDPATTNQLTIDLDICNLGNATNGMVDVVIFQYSPNGVLLNQVTQSINIPAYNENYTFVVPIPANSPNGMNSFVIEVDRGNFVYNEVCEDNNSASVFVQMINSTDGLGCTDPIACNYDATATIDDGTCDYTSCNTVCQLSIPMNFAGWHIVSSYCNPVNDSIEVIFNPIENDIVQVKNLTGQVYIPSFNNFNNGLDFWDIESGYLVKTAQPTTLNITGNQEVDLAVDNIPLYAGWNLIAYWLQGNSDPIDVFSNIANDVIQVKNLSGSYIPSFNDFNNMGMMSQTNGYYVKMNGGNDLYYDATTLAPRPTNGNSDVAERLKNTHFTKEIKPNPNSSTLVVMDDANNRMNAGDELGVFTTSGILVGAFVYENAMMGGLIFGNDETEEGIDGIQTDEKYIFKIWDKSSDEERLVEMDFIQGKDTYLMNDLCAVSFKNESTTGINSLEKSTVSVYPNPATSTIYFDINNGNTDNITVEIYDAKGQLVDLLKEASILQNNKVKYDVNHLNAGIYTYQIKNDSDVFNGKFSIIK